MNNTILNLDQTKLLSFVQTFSSEYYLVGGTAIALHLGHRRSIDFDLFTDQPFNPMVVRNKINRTKHIDYVYSQGEGELTVLVDKVKFTFFHYPFIIDRPVDFNSYIKIPKLITLGAMKVFALGKRAKWKDYVDLYFIFQKYSLKEIIDVTNSIYKAEFNEKLFRTQLSYFDDIDHTEQIEYMTGFEKNDEEIKQFLEQISLS